MTAKQCGQGREDDTRALVPADGLPRQSGQSKALNREKHTIDCAFREVQNKEYIVTSRSQHLEGLVTRVMSGK